MIWTRRKSVGWRTSASSRQPSRRVERLSAVDVRDGDDDHLELHVEPVAWLVLMVDAAQGPPREVTATISVAHLRVPAVLRHRPRGSWLDLLTVGAAKRTGVGIPRGTGSGAWATSCRRQSVRASQALGPPSVEAPRCATGQMGGRARARRDVGVGQRRAAARGRVAGTHRLHRDLEGRGRGPAPGPSAERRRGRPGRPRRARRRAACRLRLPARLVRLLARAAGPRRLRLRAVRRELHRRRARRRRGVHRRPLPDRLRACSRSPSHE